MNTHELHISVEYLNREKAEGKYVEDWIMEYCGRNKINIVSKERYGEEYLEIQFRSDWQLRCFVLRGNWKFPYFEFL